VSNIAQLRSALLVLLEEHRRDEALPTSGRFLFYELVARAGSSPGEKSGARRPDQDMTEALTHLRNNGEIPWAWIVDETRSLENCASRLIRSGNISGDKKRRNVGLRSYICTL
jgi:hypothetical protein